MPEKSGLPSIGAIGFASSALAAAAVTGVVPATVTVTAFVTAPPPIESVYVDVAFGVTLNVPRGYTSPIPLSMVAAPASVTQVSTKDSPGLIAVALASKVTIRGGSAARPAPPPPPRGACPAVAGAAGAPCGADGACAHAMQTANDNTNTMP